MTLEWWHTSPVSRRVHMLRWALPVAIAAVVIVYQLVFAAYVHDVYGHTEHTLLELLFYAGLGPIVSWAILNQISRWLNEKEAAEQAVRAGERQLASIIDASTDAILSLDAQGTIRSWNRGASLLFGYSAEEQIGRRLADLLPTQSAMDSAGQASAQLTSHHYEATVHAQDGRRLVVDVTHPGRALRPAQRAGKIGG